MATKKQEEQEEPTPVATYVVMRRRAEEIGLLQRGDVTDLHWLDPASIAFGIKRGYWLPAGEIPPEVQAELKG